MKTMLKRSMAILLILMMVISVLPMATAATVNENLMPIKVGFAPSTSTTTTVATTGTITLYRKYSATSSSFTSQSTSTSTYLPWEPTKAFLAKGYKPGEYIKVGDLRDELEDANVFDGDNGTVYTRSGTSSSYTLAASEEYYWDIYEQNTEGVLLPDSTSQAYIKLTIRVLRKSDNYIMKTSTVYVENPYLEKDYSLSYKVDQTTIDEAEKTTTVSGTFASKSANKAEVVLKSITGYYDATSFDFNSLSLGTSEYEMKYTAAGSFAKVTDANVIKEVKKNSNATNADDIYAATVTVYTTSNTAALKFHDVDSEGKELLQQATITFYQPVTRPDDGVLKIGGVTVLEKTADGTVDIAEGATGKVVTGEYDITATKTFTSKFTIPVVNTTDLSSPEYIISDVTSAPGTCVVTGYNPGSQVVEYYPLLNGKTTQEITFSIINARDSKVKATLKLNVKFSSTAIDADFNLNNTTEYNVAINSSHTLKLSDLIKDFSKFSDDQKAQFTFEISNIEDAYGRYTVSKAGKDDTAAFEKVMNKTYTNSTDVANGYYLDDYEITYSPAAVSTTTPGYKIVIISTADTTKEYYTFNIKYNVGEGVKATIATSTATLNSAPGGSSSTVYLKNYIGNFSADMGLTYKITSRTANYGTFYVGGSSATVNATGSITASAPTIYYKANSSSTADKTDTLTITVYQGNTTVGTVTYTGKVGEGDDCYTERAFNADYPGDDAFGVVVLNVNNRSYTFKASDFANGDIDLSDKDYDDYYIEVIEYPIGGELDGLDRYDTIDVADLDDLKYTRTSKSDTGIDAFEFKLYTANDKSAGSYVMWIVPNEDYLEGDTGYTEEEFKAGYAKTTAFGAYAASSGISFDMDDFKNSTYILEEDYVDGTVEITKLPIIGTLYDGSTKVDEDDELDVEELADLKYTWDDYSTSLIDCFEFKAYKKGASTGTTMTMWIVGNKSLVTGVSENWSGTSTTAPFYKVNDVEVSNNIASVTLDADWVEEALDTVKSGSDVTVAITPKTEAKGLSLTVDKSLFTLANAAKVSYITLSEGTSGASVSVSVSDILSAGGSGKNFTVTMNKLTISTGNDIVANSLVASTATAARAVTFKAGTADITFNSVGAAVLTIPYTNSSSYSDDMVVVFDYSSGNTPLVSSAFTGRAASADITKGGQYLVAVNSISFSDVSSNWAWTRGYIPSLAARGTISGMGGQNAGKYMPDGKLTRAEFIKLLVVSLGLEDNSAANPFSDMSDHWAKQVVAAAVKHSIVSSAATFGPDDPITRRDMALYAYRAAKAAGLTLSTSGSTTTFKDENEITGDYLTAIKAMQAAGIINGMGGQYEGYYLPMNGTDRASAAKIIWFLNAELYGWSTSGKY